MYDIKLLFTPDLDANSIRVIPFTLRSLCTTAYCLHLYLTAFMFFNARSSNLTCNYPENWQNSELAKVSCMENIYSIKNNSLDEWSNCTKPLKYGKKPSSCGHYKDKNYG